MRRKAPRILWAEDDPQDQQLIRAGLDGLTPDPAVEFVADGVALLEAIGRALPSLVVLDLKMPRMGGLEALRRLRAEPSTKGIPVVVFSSGSLPDEIAQIESLGVRGIVQKPIGFSELREAVRAIVQGRRS